MKACASAKVQSSDRLVAVRGETCSRHTLIKSLLTLYLQTRTHAHTHTTRAQECGTDARASLTAPKLSTKAPSSATKRSCRSKSRRPPCIAQAWLQPPCGLSTVARKMRLRASKRESAREQGVAREREHERGRTRQRVIAR